MKSSEKFEESKTEGSMADFRNGVCNPDLLSQHKFVAKEGAELLNIKIIGPNTAALEAAKSPVHIESLQNTGHLLIFGHYHYGWDAIGAIYEIASGYIKKHEIKK